MPVTAKPKRKYVKKVPKDIQAPAQPSRDRVPLYTRHELNLMRSSELRNMVRVHHIPWPAGGMIDQIARENMIKALLKIKGVKNGG